MVFETDADRQGTMKPKYKASLWIKIKSMISSLARYPPQLVDIQTQQPFPVYEHAPTLFNSNMVAP